MQIADIPESIIKKYKVSKENQSRMKKAYEYNYEPITSALNDDLIRAGRPYSVEQAYPLTARFGKVDYALAKRLEDEFKRFVTLTLITPGIPHAPPGAVDMYWHFFILHTQLYVKYCKQVWGSFEGEPSMRHHYPANDETRPGMLQAYIATRKLYIEVFGELKPFERPGALSVEVWTPESRTSGDSYSGIIEPSEKSVVSA